VRIEVKTILEQANEVIENFEEDLNILKMMKEREKRDSGRRYTDEDVDKILEEKRKKINTEMK
jgi:hypothetical protein